MKGVVLIILDGFGLAPISSGNAIELAKTSTIPKLFKSFPQTQLTASGEAVGLPAGEAGTSEVGHLNLGAGKIVYQSLPRINLSIADGSFFKNPSFLNAVSHINNTNGKLHILGLVGELNVHACMDHLFALLHFCREQKVFTPFLHLITDGRDSPPKQAHVYIRRVENVCRQISVGKIASIMGRYYAMDRDRRWERIEKAYNMLTKGEGQKSESWENAITQSYAQGKTDEFIEPTNIIESGKPVALIEEGDAVIFYNFRIDRPRELTKAFVLENFERDANKTSYDPYATKYYGSHYEEKHVLNPPFKRGPKIPNIFFVTMTEYERDLPVSVAFPPHVVKMPLGRVISEKGLFQLRLAESEKERFVTYYFNGLRETKFTFEDRLIVPSPKVPTYDLTPAMSSFKVTSILITNMLAEKYPFICVNYAPPDMVGHTGNLKAAISAIESIDLCLKRVVETTLRTNYTTIITADHGNCEQMIDPVTGGPSTEHTANPVPFFVVNNTLRGKNIHLQTGILADVAPTILYLLKIPVPQDFTGRNLLEEIASQLEPF